MLTLSCERFSDDSIKSILRGNGLKIRYTQGKIPQRRDVNQTAVKFFLSFRDLLMALYNGSLQTFY